MPFLIGLIIILVVLVIANIRSYPRPTHISLNASADTVQRGRLDFM